MDKRFFLLLFTFLIFSQITFSQVPAAPSNLKIQFYFSSALGFSWEDRAINESGFYFYKSTDGINFNRFLVLSPNSTSCTDIGLLSNTTYYYKVSAYNASGESASSNIISGIPTSMFDCNSGTDTITTPYPFYATFTDSRTQMLYLKNELTGICNVGYIWNMAVNTTSSSVLQNVTIKLKNTTDTVINKFIDTGWTTVVNNQTISTYNGWTYFSFSTPFIRDINKNLLVEICFDRTSSSTSNILVRSTAASNKVWHNHKNAGNGCTLDSGSRMPNRMNLRFTTVIDGVRKISSNTPEKYSIEQNYPNPFNGETKFRFNIKESTPATLSLYDILGRQEVVIFSEPLAPGEYEKIFSINSHPLPSGIYYYCFVANGFVSVKKMVVLK